MMICLYSWCAYPGRNVRVSTDRLLRGEWAGALVGHIFRMYRILLGVWRESILRSDPRHDWILSVRMVEVLLGRVHSGDLFCKEKI